jgi:hypothetical protein
MAIFPSGERTSRAAPDCAAANEHALKIAPIRTAAFQPEQRMFMIPPTDLVTTRAGPAASDIATSISATVWCATSERLNR